MHLLIEIILILAAGLMLGPGSPRPGTGLPAERPNILFVISDDQSYPHASVYGAEFVHTPAFDRLAAAGVVFGNAFAAAPQCSPSRAAILTGRNIWQLEEAGTHGSLFPKKFPVFTQVLGERGYLTGFTGKAWGPGNWEQAGWQQNPVGQEYNQKTLEHVPYDGLSNIDYSGNFKEFLANRDKGQPFFFWFGAKEPHRGYAYGSGVRSGKDLHQVDVPDFLPDQEVIRHDLLDYAVEIEWFDRQLGEMISLLKAAGEYDNTIIVVTSDNGMPFPYAKANLQEWGTHVPLLIAGVPGMRQGEIEDGLVSLTDLAPTLLALAGVPLAEAGMEGMAGKSILPLLAKDTGDPSGLANTSPALPVHRDYVLTGRERHTHARPDNLGYPCRAIRTADFLYIQNFKPERWPAGNPPPKSERTGPDNFDNKDFKPIGPGYCDIDDSPSKAWMIEHRDEYPTLFAAGFLKRPARELYDIRNDPYCLRNLAAWPEYDSVMKQLSTLLARELARQGDPRVTGSGDIFESYPRFGRMRNFPGFKQRGKYNTAFSFDSTQTKQ